MAEHKRVVLYGRVSVDRKGKRSKSVDQQLTELRAWANAEDRLVVAERRDDGISASQYAKGKSRPGWQEVVELLTAGDIDELVVWEQSRATRDRAVWAALMACLIESGTNLVIDGKVYDPSDPDDAYALDSNAAGDVRESGKTRKRVLRDTAARAREGRPHGPLHMGIRTEYDPETGRPLRRVLDEAQAAVVREAATRILKGETCTAVARDFNNRLIRTPTGSTWIGNNLLRSIAAPAMASLRVYRGQVLDGIDASWPSILTVDQHQRLQQILNDPTRKTVRNGTHSKHLLSGIARCGVCEGPIGTIGRNRDGSRYVVYRCRTKFCVGRKAAEVDAVVEKTLVTWLSLPDIAKRIAALSSDGSATAAAETAARLRARLDEARRLVFEEKLSLESLMDLEARTLPALKDAVSKSKPRHIPDSVMEVAGPDAPLRWKSTSIGAKREIIRALLTVHIDPAPPSGRFSKPHYSSIRVDWK